MMKRKVTKEEENGGEMKKIEEMGISLDHPQENERIVGSHYSFRIGAPGDAKQVEVSIDEGPWEPCRESAGYWWYDWTGYPDGSHQVVVRMQAQDGGTLNSQPRQFEVAHETAEKVSAQEDGSIR